MARIKPGESKTAVSSFALPVIIAIILIILIVRAFFGGSTEITKTDNSGFINITPNQEKSEILIYMSGDSSKKIEGATKMYATDNKLAVNSGEAKVTLEGNQSKIFANKLAELKYNGKNSSGENFDLLNGEIWIEADNNPLTVVTRNFTASSSGVGVFSYSQNLMASSIYILKGDISVKITADKKERNVKVGVGQKITILNTDLTDSALVLDDKIVPIDDFYKESDFFIKHNGADYLNSPANESGSGDTITSNAGTGVSLVKGGKALIINYPDDEATVDTNSLNIEGKITSKDIVKITINDKEASINKEDNTFIVKDFNLKDSINNLVYKAYDIDNNMLVKGVLTVYTTSKEKATAEQEKPTVTTYPISSKDFRIIEPAENPFKTTENIVKIAGQLNKGQVKFITINDFRLTKFPQFSSNWYYFANKDYGTMNDGINLYAIKYYGKDDELLYSSMFTIVKETTPTETQSGADSGTGSNSNG